MIEELKPCPFCGGEAKIYRPDDGSLFIGCKIGCVNQEPFAAEEGAIKAWNTRAEPDYKAMYDNLKQLHANIEEAKRLPIDGDTFSRDGEVRKAKKALIDAVKEL